MNEPDRQTTITRDETGPVGPQNAKERVYDKIHVPVWVLDIILVVLGLALVAALVIGAIKGNA